jgi:hypothetical protein
MCVSVSCVRVHFGVVACVCLWVWGVCGFVWVYVLVGLCARGCECARVGV